MQQTKLTDYLKLLMKWEKKPLSTGMLLSLGAALTEGLGLLLLIPILAIANIFPLPTEAGPWVTAAQASLEDFGIHLNLPAALIVFVALIALQSCLVMLRDRHHFALQMRFVDRLRNTLFRAIGKSRWNFLITQHSGDMLNTLTADVQRIGTGTHHTLQLATTVIMCTTYVAVAAWLSPGVTALALLTSGLLWFVFSKTRSLAKKSGTALTQANQILYSQLQEFLSALKLIKIHAEENSSLRQFNQAIDDIRSEQMEFRRHHTLNQMRYRVGAALALAGITYITLTWINQPAANLLVLIAIFARLLPQVTQAQNSIAQIWHMLPAFSHWTMQLKLYEEAKDGSALLPAHQTVGAESPGETSPVSLGEAMSLNRELKLTRVVYQHSLDQPPLEIPFLRIPAKKTTAIIGPSGSGKTTLLDLLCGLHPPLEGTISVDGIDVSLCHDSWRHGIAYVPQETTILAGTIYDNLTWGHTHYAESDLWQALQYTAAATFVRALPKGLHTPVGERGVQLSGGERQRLALARALLRRPQLLILDEATNALDRHNQTLILQAIASLRGHMTVIIVTHRPDELMGLIDGVVIVENAQVSPWQPVNQPLNAGNNHLSQAPMGDQRVG